MSKIYGVMVTTDPDDEWAVDYRYLSDCFHKTKEGAILALKVKSREAYPNCEWAASEGDEVIYKKDIISDTGRTEASYEVVELELHD